MGAEMIGYGDFTVEPINEVDIDILRNANIGYAIKET